jgi:hypothetical protein
MIHSTFLDFIETGRRQLIENSTTRLSAHPSCPRAQVSRANRRPVVDVVNWPPQSRW